MNIQQLQMFISIVLKTQIHEHVQPYCTVLRKKFGDKKFGFTVVSKYLTLENIFYNKKGPNKTQRTLAIVIPLQAIALVNNEVVKSTGDDMGLHAHIVAVQYSPAHKCMF